MEVSDQFTPQPRKQPPSGQVKQLEMQGTVLPNVKNKQIRFVTLQLLKTAF